MAGEPVLAHLPSAGSAAGEGGGSGLDGGWESKAACGAPVQIVDQWRNRQLKCNGCGYAAKQTTFAKQHAPGFCQMYQARPAGQSVNAAQLFKALGLDADWRAKPEVAPRPGAA